MIMSRRYFIALFLFISAGFAFTYSSFSQTTGCNYYASPSGGGNGSSLSAPFKISNFWSVAGPGKTLCLLDGTYTGIDSMITPPQNLKGLSGSPITIKALNEGKVLLNGQASGTPIKLYYNDWFVIEGVNACCSSADVIYLSHATNNIVRRVIGWDARDNNNMIFGIAYGSSNNLFEDVAGWGVARKIFEPSGGSNYVTLRRFWGRWERSTVTGPKMVLSMAYDSNYNMTYENAIGTWSAEKMPSSYTLTDYSGNPCNFCSSGPGPFTEAMNFPYGILSDDGLAEGQERIANSKLLGSIAYINKTDTFNGEAPIFVNAMSGIELRDNVVFIDSSHSSVKRFVLTNDVLAGTASGGGVGMIAKNLTGIGGAASGFQSQWQKSNILEGSGLNIFNPGENIFNATRGASVCYQYKDGVLTNQPLWPWPMDQRIKDAMAVSGHRSVTYGMPTNDGLVTTAIENMFGAIPAQCRSGSRNVLLTPPSAPLSLQIQIQSSSLTPNLMVSPTAVALADTVLSTWSGVATPNPNDWIGIYPVGAVDANYIDWFYTSCNQNTGSAGASGTCVYVLPSQTGAGNYNVRLFAGNMAKLATSNPFMIVTSPVITVAPTTVGPSWTITSTWAGLTAPTADDWIGIYPVGAADANYADWFYTSCNQDSGIARAGGSCNYLLPLGMLSGNYDVRLFTGSMTKLATFSAITVGSNVTFSSGK